MSGSSLVILDSNIVIYLSQRKLSIDDVFDNDKEYAISLVTYMEILSYNLSSREEEFIHKLLSLFRIIDITQSVANKVIHLKKKRKIKLPDAIIIATTLVEKAILYTNDKQLHGVEELNIRYFECKNVGHFCLWAIIK
jgi:predicted nucleic acid-binding protein